MGLHSKTVIDDEIKVCVGWLMAHPTRSTVHMDLYFLGRPRVKDSKASGADPNT